MSLDEAVRLFLANLSDERRCSPRTVTSYRQELGMFTRWCTGTGLASPASVTRDHVVTYLGPDGDSGSSMSPATRNRKLTILRSFFRYAVDRKITSTNPARDVRYSRLARKEQPSLTRAEVAHVLTSVSDVVPWRQARNRCIVVMLFNTGLRLDELLSLDLGQVDADNQLLHEVRRKGGSEQPLPLNDAAMDAMKLWLKERVTMAVAGQALFVVCSGGRLSGRAVQARLKTIGAAAGFPFLHPHVLRHSFATELLATGANLEEVRRLMGHTSIVTTSRYSHPDQEALRRAVGRLSGRKGGR